MQIKSLRYFLELARTGSFYSASKSLVISQQGLSKAVASLEDELGLALVERGRRGIRLTREGEVFFRHAEAMVAQHDAMLAELYATRRAQGVADDRVMVHVSYYSAQIASFDPNYIKMLAGDTAYIEEPFEKMVKRAASSDGTDLVFFDLHSYSAGKVKSDPAVVFDPVLCTRYGIVWRDPSPFKGKSHVHREEVCGIPVALNASREISALIDWLFEDFSALDVRMGATSSRMLLEYVRQSDEGAIAFFDSFAFYLARKYDPELVQDLHFTPLSTPRAVCELGFLYPRAVKLSLRAQNVVVALRRHLEAHCPDYHVDEAW